LAGLLLAASFPKISIAGFAWVAPGFILLTAIGKPPRQTFRIGYVAGLANFLASLYWLLLIPVKGFPILGWIVLGAFLALGTGLWVWLSWKFYPAKLDGEGAGAPLENLGAQFFSVPWASRTMWTISCAATWVAVEMVQARIFGGFPWNLLASSQYKLVPLIQIASITGIYGVSFLVGWTSVSFLCAGVLIVRKPALRSGWIGEIILPALAVIVIYGTGWQKIMKPARPSPEITVALVQPSIPQTLIWDTNQNSIRFEQLLRLSSQAVTNKPDVMFWPEGAIPEMVRYDPATHDAVTSFARKHKVWMIVGSDDAEPHPGTAPDEEPDFFNSSFLVSPSGILVERYKKRNLVMFGEYIPLLRWLPFLKYVTPIQAGFTPGDKVVPFKMPDLNVNVSVLICFEDTFPQLVREYVFDDTDFLVNLTNDGWFGESSAQWQHAVAALFRTVENGVPLVRCSNNGLTCWIDSFGRLRDKGSTGGVYGKGFLIARIPVLNPNETRVATFYRLHGDVFGWACVALAILRWAQVSISTRRTK